MAWRIAILFLFTVIGPAAAQAERYELGQRLKAFEKAWDKQPDPAARKRALEILPKVTQQFFSLQLGEAGRTLDEARWRLESVDEPSDATKWLTSLYANPERRLYSPDVKKITVTLNHFYKPKTAKPAKVFMSIGFPGNARVVRDIDNLPYELDIPAPYTNSMVRDNQGDHFLQLDYVAGIFDNIHRDVLVSTVETSVIGEGLLKLMNKEDKKYHPVIKATMKANSERIRSLNRGEVLESDFYANSVYQQNQSYAMMGRMDQDEGRFQALSELLFPGTDVYLSIPAKGEKSIFVTNVRFCMPKTTDIFGNITPRIEKQPLVVALHGAGGSENLFFEGYGNGHAIKECLKRGWYLVAPASPLSITGSGPPLKSIIDSLAELYMIDKNNIFILGHSMGAMQTIAACQENPGMFKAAAALGGGGRVRDAIAFETLPVFVGVGDKDFALSIAKSLAKTLKDGGAKNVTYKEYPDLEHLVIVREALPDVFKMFDACIQKK